MKPDCLPPPLMVVDDNEDDVILFTRHLKTAGITNPLLHFRTGGDAFLFLKQFCETAAPTSARLPTAMFLDINMQGLSGFDVLLWARQQPELEDMKIYMLSGAKEAWDAQIAEKLGADEYIEKFPPPLTLKELLRPVISTNSSPSFFAPQGAKRS